MISCEELELETLAELDLQTVNRELTECTAAERVRWAHETFGTELVMSTSFGIQAALTLHLVVSVIPEIPVIFIDTGYLFPETYRFAEQLTERLNLNLKIYHPRTTAARQEALHGKRWEQGRKQLEAYNLENKVEPMNRALSELGASAWISGLRRAQASTRTHLRPLERQNRTYKLHPVIDWNERDVYEYLNANGLPYHPLWEEGYASVGDVHSSAKIIDGMSAEDSRFNGLKRECGIHEASDRVDFQI